MVHVDVSVSGVRGLAERGGCSDGGRHAGGHGARPADARPLNGRRHARAGLAGRLLPGDVFVAAVHRPGPVVATPGVAAVFPLLPPGCEGSVRVLGETGAVLKEISDKDEACA